MGFRHPSEQVHWGSAFTPMLVYAAPLALGSVVGHEINRKHLILEKACYIQAALRLQDDLHGIRLRIRGQVNCLGCIVEREAM